MAQSMEKREPTEGDEALRLEDLRFGLWVTHPVNGPGYIANTKHTEDSVMVIVGWEEEYFSPLSELKLYKFQGENKLLRNTTSDCQVRQDIKSGGETPVRRTDGSKRPQRNGYLGSSGDLEGFNL